jgi:hypothetical protein
LKKYKLSAAKWAFVFIYTLSHGRGDLNAASMIPIIAEVEKDPKIVLPLMHITYTTQHFHHPPLPLP